jgi:hypothetical protein
MMPRRSLGTVDAILIVASLAPAGASAQAPWWVDSLAYAPAQVTPIRVGTDGFPYVRVRIETTELWLLFDTGNMAGLTLATRYYDGLRLPEIGRIRRRDSSGEPVGEFRMGRAARVEALGHTSSDAAVREFEHPRIAGLFGPGELAGSRFTLDYGRRLLAVTDSALEMKAGPRTRHLIRSARHPRLIIVEGRFRGRSILIELDTGKSRAVVDPTWARRVGLAVGHTDTVAVGTVELAGVAVPILDAKPVGLGAIDPDLPAPLVLSLGSDVLSQFLLTVDYAQGLVLLWDAE